MPPVEIELEKQEKLCSKPCMAATLSSTGDPWKARNIAQGIGYGWGKRTWAILGLGADASVMLSATMRTGFCMETNGGHEGGSGVNE